MQSRAGAERGQQGGIPEAGTGCNKTGEGGTRGGTGPGVGRIDNAGLGCILTPVLGLGSPTWHFSDMCQLNSWRRFE